MEKIIRVSVSRPAAGAPAVYEFMTTRMSLAELGGKLADLSATGQKVQVRVSYDGNVPWGDVMEVFNECAKSRIEECGLVPLRGIDAPGPG